MTAQCFLGEDQAAIHRHLEDTARRLDQLDLGVRVPVANLRRQTDGAGPVISHHTELDAHLHRLLLPKRPAIR